MQANEEATAVVSRTKDSTQLSLPSKIFTLISSLTSELSNIFSEGMHYFRTAKEDDSGEEESRNAVEERDKSAVGEKRAAKDHILNTH